MMKTYTFFIFLVVLCIFSYFQTIFAITRIQDLNVVEELYRESYVDSEISPNNLCDIDNSIKVAICNTIFNDESFQKEFRIYLNKKAITEYDLECENNSVFLHTFPRHQNVQPMFPCYGRHNPLQTQWDIDDNYRFIFLSGGPDDTIFVYYHLPTLQEDEFHVREIIREIIIEDLAQIAITEEDLEVEEQSLHLLSIYNIRSKIEYNYIKNIIYKEFSPRYSICALSPIQKLRLCEKITESYRTVESFKFKLQKDMFEFMNISCTKKKIMFTHHNPKETEEIERDMFTCYGYIKKDRPVEPSELSEVQLSDGYYKNSVLLFLQTMAGEEPYYYMKASIHNINIQNVYYL